MAKDWLNGLHSMYLFQNWSPKHVYTYIKINTLLIENTIFIHQRSDQLPGIIHARLKGQSFTCPGNTYTRRTIDFPRNGRREVGNFAAQERNYGSPDETWLAIGLSSYPDLRRAPPILTEARPLFSPGRRRHAAASNGLAGGFN